MRGPSMVSMDKEPDTQLDLVDRRSTLRFLVVTRIIRLTPWLLKSLKWPKWPLFAILFVCQFQRNCSTQRCSQGIRQHRLLTILVLVLGGLGGGDGSSSGGGLSRDV